VDLEYVATNKILVPNSAGIDNYLKLCFSYFRGHATNDECTPITKPIYETLIAGVKSIDKTFGKELPLEDLCVTNYGHLGFCTQIIFDKPQNSFKLRLFADKKLRERGFSSTYEPLRHYLTSGPRDLGLKVIKEVEDGIEVPKEAFSFQDLEKHQQDALNYWLKHYTAEADVKIDDSMDPEEALYYMDDSERARKQVKKIKLILSNLGKNSFKDKLKSNSKLFSDLRKEFLEKFSDCKALQNTALGVLPWHHYSHLAGNFGTVLDEEGYLPNFVNGGFTDHRANFMEAELIVPPTEDCCKHIISLFPYTWRIIPEFNKVQEEFFDDTEIIQAMMGHELGEIVLGEGEAQCVSPFDLLLNTSRMRDVRENYEIQQQNRHVQIDKLMVEMGLGEQTKKMLKVYKSNVEKLLPKYNYNLDLEEQLKQTIEELNKTISNL
jgi:hypothetical protein